MIFMLIISNLCNILHYVTRRLKSSTTCQQLVRAKYNEQKSKLHVAGHLCYLPVTIWLPLQRIRIRKAFAQHDILAKWPLHYSDLIMGAMASQITSLTIVYSTADSGVDQRKYQSSVPLAFGMGIHRWLVNSRTKGQ